MKRLLINGLVILMMLSNAPLVLRAHDISGEISASVPALSEFHKVIYEVWHTAWPNRDYDMLIALTPDIEKGTAAIIGADLPGILRDKKAAWKKGVEELQSIVLKYRAAAENKQKQQILDLAEKLHAQYEALVRVIRPPLSQLEEFHTVLYMVYHYYMRDGEMDKIRASVDPLREKMSALNKAALPTRSKGKETSFTTARQNLEKTVLELARAVSSNDPRTIKAAVESMHSSYVTLAAVLE